MGRLSGFRYREIIKHLKTFGFRLDRQAAGSHEIWYNEQNDSYTTIPNHSGDMPECKRERRDSGIPERLPYMPCLPHSRSDLQNT